jgi:hypothetical protein
MVHHRIRDFGPRVKAFEGEWLNHRLANTNLMGHRDLSELDCRFGGRDPSDPSTQEVQKPESH